MTTTKAVQDYVMGNPPVKDCLARGIVNYAALGRRIVGELGSEVSSFEAVVIALRRLQEKLAKGSQSKRIMEVLKNSTLEIKSRICAVTIEKDIFSEPLMDVERMVKKSKRLFFAIEGTETITLIFQSTDLAMVRGRFKRSIVNVREDMSLISLHCEGVQSVPGVTAYLSGLFYEHDVNIYEFMSCWSDNLFIIKTGDVGKVIQFLEF